MAIEVTDIKFFRSATITDTAQNGGQIDVASEVVDGVKYNLFPRVSHSERTNGVTRYRKFFMANRNSLNETAYEAMFAVLKPSNGGDRFYLHTGTHTDTQAEASTYTYWTGGGRLNQSVAAGDTSMQVLMEADDYEFWPGQLLYLSDGVNEAWVNTANVAITAEVIGTGNGAQTSFNHTASQLPVQKGSTRVLYTIAGNALSASDDGNGSISGTGISVGTINYETGAVALQFSTAPDNATAITMDYTKACYTRTGNVAIIALSTQIASAFSSADTYVGACVPCGDLRSTVTEVNKVSANGNVDGAAITSGNIGAVADIWTLTFISANEFTCYGTYSGAQPNGLVTAGYSPANASDGGSPFFTITTAAWSGVWQTGDTVTFTTSPASCPLWLKEVVPAGTQREPANVVEAVWFVE